MMNRSRMPDDEPDASVTHVDRTEELLGDVTVGRDAGTGSSDLEDAVQGIRLGRYILLERLGQGAMGKVYLAYDPDLARQVAVKVLRRAALSGGDLTRDPKRRFLREAQAAGHSVATFRTFDADADAALTREEFVSGYAQQLASRGGNLARDLQDENARILASRRKANARTNAADEADATNAADRAAAARVANARTEAARTTTARERASNALTRLRERRTANARTAGVERLPERGAQVGPAERRIAAPRARAEDLGRLLRERRQRAAERSADDPRVEEARRRVQTREAERSGSQRGRSGVRDTSGARSGRGGPAAGRSGTAGASRRTGSRGN